MEVDAALLSPPSATPQAAPNAGSSSGLTVVPAVVHKKKKFRLTSVNDALYGSIRDSNFAVVGHKLSKDARRLDSEFRVCSKTFKVCFSNSLLHSRLGSSPSSDGGSAQRLCRQDRWTAN